MLVDVCSHRALIRGEEAGVLGEKSPPRFERRSLKKWAEGVTVHYDKVGTL